MKRRQESRLFRSVSLPLFRSRRHPASSADGHRCFVPRTSLHSRSKTEPASKAAVACSSLGRWSRVQAVTSTSACTKRLACTKKRKGSCLMYRLCRNHDCGVPNSDSARRKETWVLVPSVDVQEVMLLRCKCSYGCWPRRAACCGMARTAPRERRLRSGEN